MQLETRAVPAIATWDGGGGNNNWTTAANWAGDVAPVPGDDLVFPAGALRLVNVNDFPDHTTFGTLTASALGYKLGGNSLSLTGGVMGNAPFEYLSPDNPTLEFGLALTGTPLTVTVTSGALAISGPISGAGGIVAKGGTLALSGANTYTGPTTLVYGVLEVRSNTALGAVGVGNETTVADGTTMDLFGPSLNVAEPIQFSGRGIKRTLQPADNPVDAGAIANFVGTNTLSGPLTLTGDALIGGSWGSNRVFITKGIGEVGGSHNLDIDVKGLGLEITSTALNTLSGLTKVIWQVDIQGTCVGPVLVSGTLSGTGSLGFLTTTSTGTAFATIGPLTTSGLELNNGTNLVIGQHDHSRFVVHGTAKIGGPMYILPSAEGLRQLNVGEVLRIIDNDGTDPVVGVFSNCAEGAMFHHESFSAPLRLSYHGGDGNDVVLVAENAPASAAGAGPGGEPVVNVYDVGGNLLRSFFAYDREFRGGVRVATADVTGDGVSDVVTAPGPGGGPHVRIWDGQTGALFREFFAYDPSFTGGVSIAAANTFPEGTPVNPQAQHAEIVTGAGPGGGPHVKVFDGRDGSLMSSFFAYDPSFRGGVNVAATPAFQVSSAFFPGDVITGAGPGGGPHVRVFKADTGQLAREFFAYDPDFRGGVSVAYTSNRLQGLSDSNIVTAPGSGSAPAVKVFNFFGQLRSSFLAYDEAFRGGVNVAVRPLGLNGQNVIETGAGPNGGPHVRQWAFPGPTTTRDFFAFDPGFTGGVFVG